MFRKHSSLIILVLVFLAVGILWLTDSRSEASTVNVTAQVTSSVTCSTDVGATNFAVALNVADVATSTPNASTTLSCNTGLGCTLTVQDEGDGANPGLASSTSSFLIPSNTATLSAGTEGYGIQATTTASGSGGAIGIPAVYGGSKFNTNAVGALSRTPQTLASSTAAIAGREVVVKHKAAISITTAAAYYNDTITYSCSGN